MNTSTPESLRFFSSPQMIDLLQVPINAVPSHQSSPGTTSEEASGADKTDLEETGEVRQKSALNSNSFPYPFIRLISLLELPRN
mmetsp:Transcript_33371/g.80716  ORF Transcript_33371/g.80716 Transcript_33371/m.80716 type:complete len:84 (-) Transcript_33371:1063-1314(-)